MSFFAPSTSCKEAADEHRERRTGEWAVGEEGVGIPHCPDKTTVAFSGASPTFSLTEIFFFFLTLFPYGTKPCSVCLKHVGIIWASEQNPLFLQLWEACVPGCVSSTSGGKDPYPSSVSLFGQACLEATSCHITWPLHPSGFSLVLLEPTEVWTHVGQSQNSVGPIQRLTDPQPKAN